MTSYAYWGNKNEQIDGTSAIIVESGEVMVGYSGDFTPLEIDELGGRYLLVPATVDPAHPIRRSFFPWVREDIISGAVIGAGGPPQNVTPPDITPAAPSNTVAPTLSGSAQQGATLTTSNGTWVNSPTSYTYYWETSSNGTSGWTTLGHTANTYTVQAGDVGNYLRCQVTATNDGGSTVVNSNVDGPIVASGGSTPVNSAAPAVTGTTQQGSVLTTTNGTWTNSPTGYTYQWQTNASGSFANLSGATSSTYTSQSSDVGHNLRCVVTASNGSGSSAPANSNSVGPITGVPVNSVVPTISGTAQQGSVLTATNGTWTNSPTSYAYQWQTSANGTSGWTNKSGATSSTYTCVSGDVGNYLRCQVVATNAVGSGTAASSGASAQVAAPPTGTPIAVVQSAANPTLTGTPPVYIAPFASPTTDGNTIVIGLQFYGQGGTVVPHVSSVVDGVNTFQVATASDQTLSGTPDYGLHTVFYYCENIVGKSSHAITITLDTNQVYVFVTLWELNPSAFDQANGNTGTTSSGPTTVDAGTLTPSANGAAAFFMGNTDGDPNSTYWSVTGWTVEYQAQGGSGSTVTAHKLQSTAAALDLGIAYANTQPMWWCASGIIFKPSVSTGVPVNSVVPTLSGTAQQSHVLTASSGGWTQSPSSYAYQWQTSANGTSGWSNLSGATASTYTCVSGDVGKYLRCQVTASNSFGSSASAASSAASAQITAASPISLVQIKAASWTRIDSSGDNGEVGLDSSTTLGNTLVLGIKYGGDATVTGITDSSGGANTWTIISSSIQGSSVEGNVVWAYCLNAHSISWFDFTVNIPTTGQYCTPTFYELTPGSLYNVSVGSGTTSGASSGSPATIQCASLTPSEDGAFIISQYNLSGAGNDYTVGSGFTQDFNAGGIMVEHMAQATAAATTGLCHTPDNGQWSGDMIVFVP